MAPSVVSYQSQELIDVSKNAQTPANSSPVGTTKSPAQAAEEERIADSMDANLHSRIGGAVQPPAHVAEGEDELYDLSPKGRASLEAIRSSAKVLKKSVEAQSPKDHAFRAPVQQPGPERLVNKHARPPKTAIDALLDDGAAARESQIEKQRIKTGSKRGASLAQRSSEGELTKSQPNATQSRSRQTQKPTKKAVQPVNKDIPPAKNERTTSKLSDGSAPPAGRSALAALQAKSTGKPMAEPIDRLPSSRNGAAATTTTSKKKQVLQERDKNARTPAPTTSKVSATQQQSTSSKLKSLETGMFAQTPLVPTAARAPRAPQGSNTLRDTKTVDGIEGDLAISTRTGGNAMGAGQDRKEARGATKRPAATPAASKSNVGRRTTYDVPQSPPSAKDAKVSKQAAKAKQRVQKAQGVQHEVPIEAHPEAGVPKRRPGRPRKPRKIVDSSDPEAAEPGDTSMPPAKADVDGLDRVPVRKSARNKAPATVAADAKPVAAPALDHAHTAGDQDDIAHETIEDFENAMVNFNDDEARAIRPSKHASAEPRGGLQKGRQPQADASADVGTSQENAIMLSDRAPTSSPELSEPDAAGLDTAAATGPAQKAKVTAKPPQTPAALQSSPPIAQQRDRGHDTAGLHDTEASRKTTIIGFDRTGPLNQGARSIKKGAATLALSDRRSFDAHRRKGPSSAAASMKAYRTDRTAPPSNVADDVEDALAGFKKPDHTAPARLLVSDSAKASAATKRRENVPVETEDGDGDDGFTYIGDDADATVATIIKTMPAKPIGVQQAVNRTESQQAMPPPPGKASQAEGTLRRNAVPTSGIDRSGTQPVDSNVNRTQQTDLKRHRGDDDANGPAMKKARATEADNHMKAPPKLSTILAPTKVPPSDIRSAQFRSHQQIAASRQPVQQKSSKISRNASQGNVDISGSPIPKNMLVPDNATALEVYSQQAQLSSDDTMPLDFSRNRTKVAASLANDATFFDELLAVPSRPPEVRSSNEKRRPASPQEGSQAITEYVLGEIDPQNLVIRDEALPPATDPFTSSEEARREPIKGSSSSLLAEQLRLRGAQGTRKRRLAYAEDDDSDKTLVEPEPEPKRPRHKAGAARKVMPRSQPHDAANHEKDDDADMPAIGLWRHGLQAHQMNLFDELVGVSHKLVRHLVDRETAMREAIDDYWRRGLTLVEEMERTHAREYKQSMQKLEQKREEEQARLDLLSEKLQGQIAERKQAKAARSKRIGKIDEEEQRLREMMAELC